MCTLITVDRHTPALIDRIKMDGRSNRDGWSLLMIDREGRHTLVRSLNLDVILANVDSRDWARIFLHSRMATQGAATVQNCHGWLSQSGVFYFHNGVLRNEASKKLRVDSMIIGKWIDEFKIPKVFDELNKEPFANVLMVDPAAGKYYAFKSSSGSLYTDLEGNFSTQSFGAIDRKAEEGFYYTCELPAKPARAVVSRTAAEKDRSTIPVYGHNRNTSWTGGPVYGSDEYAMQYGAMLNGEWTSAETWKAIVAARKEGRVLNPADFRCIHGVSMGTNYGCYQCRLATGGHDKRVTAQPQTPAAVTADTVMKLVTEPPEKLTRKQRKQMRGNNRAVPVVRATPGGDMFINGIRIHNADLAKVYARPEGMSVEEAANKANAERAALPAKTIVSTIYAHHQRITRYSDGTEEKTAWPLPSLAAAPAVAVSAMPPITLPTAAQASADAAADAAADDYLLDLYGYGKSPH